MLLHGWTFAPIWTAHTGAPFTLYDTTNSSGNIYPRASPSGSGTFSRSGLSSPVPTGNPDEWTFINLPANAFSSTYVNPKTLTSDFGPYPANMLPRDYFRGPGSWNVDMGIYKTTKVTERLSIQLRGEMYNLFNHANLFAETGGADIGNGPGVPILATRDGRRDVQLAVKFIF
jgi:hypothetical protein